MLQGNEKKGSDLPPSNQALTDLLNPVALIQSLLNKPDQYWVDLATKYLGPRAPVLRVFGNPSKPMQQQVTEEVEARINQRMTQIGPHGLKRLEEWTETCKRWLEVS